MIRQICIAISAAGALAAVAAGPAFAAPEKKEVTIGIPVKASTFLPIYIADEKKFFEKHGVKAKIVPFRGGSALVRAMIAGSVDIGITSLAGVTVGIKAGQDIKVFYGGFNMVLFDWYAVKGIKSIKDAKGKKFGISRYGSSTDFLTRYALKANGLDPKKDVQIIQGGGSSARLAAMESGQLDVNILAPPFTMIAAKRGMPRILKQADLSADYPWHVFFATGAFLKKNPETTKAVLKGFVEGVRLMKSDKAFASKVLMKATKTKAEFAEPTVDLIKDYIYEDGRLPSEKGMKTFWDIGVDSGVYKSAWDKKRYWIGDFASTYSKWKP